MRYLMFPLTALFLLACGDTDNPVVPTAPAGKATVDLSAEECAATESLPDGFLEQARAVDPDIDATLLLTMWKAHGCADWALWGLIWLSSLELELELDGEVEIHVIPPETTELETSYSHVDGGPPRIDEVRIPPPPPLEPELAEILANTPEQIKYFEDNWRDQYLREAGALSTVSVSGEKRTITITRKDKNGIPYNITTHYAFFTFTRTGGHIDEPLSVQFNSGYATETSGFGAGEETFEYRVAFTAGQTVAVSLVPGWYSGMSGNYTIGTPSSASVTF